ncbi:MAG: class I tRNA ligase family protein, partial [Pseudonocardiales bacterium]
IVHCGQCGEVAVPDDQLPVVLPDLRGHDLAPKGVSPLASATGWANVPCPRCGGAATRDTDTMDTFVDSSWYFLRYCSPAYDQGPFDPAAVREWMPAHQYVGGVEHAILHSLYSRFFTKVLHDMGMVDFTEPFTALLNQGQVINQGKSMSKSLGNGVDLGEELNAHGVDAIRLTVLFAGPPEEDMDWADVSAAGSGKFLARAWRVWSDVAATAAAAGAGDHEVRRGVARLVHEVTGLVEGYRFNVAIARLMELTSLLRRAIDTGPGAGDLAVREGAQWLAVQLSLFAPYTAEDGWALLGHDVEGGDVVGRSAWPVVDETLLVEAAVTCVVQVAGKVRARLQVPPGVDEGTLRDLALADEAVRRSLGDREIRTVIIRPPGLVNVVPA